jgi:predicted O-methyltransferase YrrM
VAIFTDHVIRYLQELKPERPPVLAEMEAFAETEHVPIVHWETGRFLATLVRATDPALVLEVGTAIGYSTLHMAEQLRQGRVITLELREDRARQARDFFERAGVSDRVELIEGDARETIPSVEGPIDLLFVDATKDQYEHYIELAGPKLSERAVLVIDNMLMSGEVALGEGEPTRWREQSLSAARRLSAELLGSERWLASVLPVGDGIAFAVRR